MVHNRGLTIVSKGTETEDKQQTYVLTDADREMLEHLATLRQEILCGRIAAMTVLTSTKDGSVTDAVLGEQNLLLTIGQLSVLLASLQSEVIESAGEG